MSLSWDAANSVMAAANEPIPVGLVDKTNGLVFGDIVPHWENVVAVARRGVHLELSDRAWARIDNAQAIAERMIAKAEGSEPLTDRYSTLDPINPTFGEMPTDAQHALLDHACGLGAPLSIEQTRAIICASVINYSHGHCGIGRTIVQALLDLLNNGITPRVPAQGAAGYSTYMAHIGLVLLGVGEVQWCGQTLPAARALTTAKMLSPAISARDARCLINGNPCMTGLACLTLADAHNLADWADVIGAMSFEALRGQMVAFDEEVLALKPHPGMQVVGARLRALLADSEIIASNASLSFNDTPSLRAIPYIHGACRDQLSHAAQQIDIELACATDNPLLIGTPEHYRVIEQAPVQGESLVMAADLVCLAIGELAGIAERRLERLVNPSTSDLPALLSSSTVLHSGMMIAQYVAAVLVGENRALAQAAMADHFESGNWSEDALQLSVTPTLKMHKLLENSLQVLAIEYLLAGQAFEFLKSQRFGSGTGQAWILLRQHVAAYEQDRWLAPDIAAAVGLLRGRAPLSAML